MTSMRARPALLSLRTGGILTAALLSAAACTSKTTPPPVTDAGSGPVADDCHSSSQALMNADCQMSLDGGKTGYINPSGDREWYHLTLPATLPDRPLLTVTTGMVSAPSSPVRLNVNVFTSDGVTSLGLTTDPEPRGEPTTFTMTVPLTNVSGDIYFLIYDDPGDDSGGTAFDARHQFSIAAAVESDPDTASHNVTAPTAITLDNTGTGTAPGVLSTTGDVDYFMVTVPAMTRPILYVGIDAPALVPAPQTRLQFSIYSSTDAGVPLGGAVVASPSGEQQTATATLLSAPGDYLIVVSGYQADPDGSPVPGDLREAYTLTAIAVADLDKNEPNDTSATATPVAMTAQNQPVTVEGRISYVPDPDWYSVTIPASGQNTILKYQVAYNSGAANNARYPAMAFVAPEPNANTLVFTLGTPGGMDPQACIQTCPGDPVVSQTTCGDPTTPQCNFATRYEDFPDYPGLDNFVGVIPVPKSSTPTKLFALLEVQEQNASDDRDYTITFTWEPESSNEANNYQDTVALAPTIQMAVNGSYAEQPSGTTAATGDLLYGLLGRSASGSQATNTAPLVATAINDYDAVNDTDLWHLTLPNYNIVNPLDGGLGPNAYADGGYAAVNTFPDGGYGVPDLAWSLAWTVNQIANQPMGSRPYDLFITFFFCDPASNPTCDPLLGTWYQASLGYRSDQLASWYGGTPQAAYDFDPTSGSFAAKPNQCLCLESRFVAGGDIYMAVSGVDRASYNSAGYSVTTSAAPYNEGPTNWTGMSQTCPSPCQECGGGGCPQVMGIPNQTP